VSAEAPPGFAQHVYRCSFAAPHPIERVPLQALHKESAQVSIFVHDGLLQSLRPCTKIRLRGVIFGATGLAPKSNLYA
jgi:hypothetical protein